MRFASGKNEKMNSERVPTPGFAAKVDLIAGILCLDFANTVEPRIASNGRMRDYLTSYDELIAWSLHAGSLDTEEGETLRKAAADQPDAAQAALAQALTLREAIYGTFSAIAEGEQADPQALQIIMAAYAQAMDKAHFMPSNANFTLSWSNHPADLAHPLWAVARSAFELLTQGEMHRIKDCPHGEGGCGWLFYDSSKNNSRRWCSMRGCGNPAKERRRAQRRSNA